MTRYIGFKVTSKLRDGRVSEMKRVGFTDASGKDMAIRKIRSNSSQVGRNDEVVVVPSNNFHRSQEDVKAY